MLPLEPMVKAVVVAVAHKLLAVLAGFRTVAPREPQAVTDKAALVAMATLAVAVAVAVATLVAVAPVVIPTPAAQMVAVAVEDLPTLLVELRAE
jgi:hypothetical protein